MRRVRKKERERERYLSLDTDRDCFPEVKREWGREKEKTESEWMKRKLRRKRRERVSWQTRARIPWPSSCLCSSGFISISFPVIPFLFLHFFPFLPDDLIYHCPNHGVHLILSLFPSLSCLLYMWVHGWTPFLLLSVFLLFLSLCANFLLCFVSPFHVMSLSLSVSASVFSILKFSCLPLTDFLSLTLITCLPRMQCFYWNCENFLLCLSFLFLIFSSLSSVNLHSLLFSLSHLVFRCNLLPKTRQGAWRINYKSKEKERKE